MEYSRQFEDALVAFRKAPEKPGVLDGPFWTMLVGAVCEVIHGKGDLVGLLDKCGCMFNYGVCEKLMPDAREIVAKIEDIPIEGRYWQISTFATWANELVNKIRHFDKRDALQNELRNNEHRYEVQNREVDVLRTSRNEKLQEIAASACDPGGMNELQRLYGELAQHDMLQPECLKIRKAVSKGTFFSVDQKRENAAREARLTKTEERIKGFIDRFGSGEAVAELRRTVAAINEGLLKIVDLEMLIRKNQADIDSIEKAQKTLSPLELENAIREELEHVRDMTRLSSKRMHLDNCPVLTEGKKYLTRSRLIECLDRVLEFDPLLFKNERVAVAGRPRVVMVPGNGTTVYDWKNNVLLVPVIITADNPMASISAGMIEYRLDTDEDHKMLTSYNALPEYARIRSSIQIKAQLTKDYISWMTQEYSGYRVLSKNVKEWFEHEIGPNKNEIFVPPAYQTHQYSSAEFNALLKAVDERIESGGLDKTTGDDLWVGSILWYHQGNFQRSFDLLGALCGRNIADPMAYFNYAQTALKVMQKTQALKGFTEFISRAPQCWWTRIADDHRRKLMGNATVRS